MSIRLASRTGQRGEPGRPSPDARCGVHAKDRVSTTGQARSPTRIALLLAAWVAATSGVVAAQAGRVPGTPTAGASATGTQALDPVVVTASRQPQSLTQVLADVSVIGPEEIAAAGVDSLAELLQRQPGVEIVQNGGPAAVSGVFLRGANRGQTLVLVDGVRLASSSTGAASLEAIPLDQIERIEILRGPASSLYGADAIGGVIQVFTKKGGGPLTLTASGGYGTYRTWDAKAGISGSSGPLTYAVQFAAKESAGFNAIANPANPLYSPDPDGYTNQSVTASAGLTFAPEQVLSAQYFRSRLNSRFDGGPDYDDRTITIAETWQVTSSNRLASFWTSQLTAASGIDDSRSQTGFGSFDFKTTQNQYTWQNQLALPVGNATAGVERREERLAEDAGFPVTARNTNSVFGIYQLRAGDQALQANLRYDRSDQYGGETTGSLAYSLQVLPELRFTAGYATGFKAPSFNDLYYPFFSNPDLVPETSRNVEGGVYWTGSLAGAAFELRAIAYRNRVSELIVFQCDANWNCAPQNVDTAILDGVTIGLDLRRGDGATLTASLDLQDPHDEATGKILPRRARQHGTLALSYPVGPLRLGAELVASGLRYDDAANLIKLGGYAIVNLTAEWALGNRVTLLARATNVFDKNYELAAGYATGGAQLYAGLRAQWK